MNDLIIVILIIAVIAALTVDVSNTSTKVTISYPSSCNLVDIGCKLKLNFTNFTLTDNAGNQNLPADEGKR